MSEENVQQYISDLPDNQAGIALDIGANIGRYTSLIASKFEKCIAFEPEPSNANLLRRNVKGQNVDIYTEVMGDHEGITKLYKSSHPGCHTINESEKHFREWGFSYENYIWVPCTTLDTVAKNNKNIRFIKCDVEGGENILFYHGKNLLIENKLSMILEVHVNIDFDRLYTFFRDLGYRIYSLDNQKPVDDFKNEMHYIVCNT